MGRNAQRPGVSVGDNNLARGGKDQQHFSCLCSLDPFVRASVLNVNHITFPWKYKQAHPANGCLPSEDHSVLAPFSLRSVLGQIQYWSRRQILAVSSWKEMTVVLPRKEGTVPVWQLQMRGCLTEVKAQQLLSVLEPLVWDHSLDAFD